MIEILESRIAPAAVFTYKDVDGDAVTITTSKGTNAELADILSFNDPVAANPRQLREIDFSLGPLDIAGKPVFAGTSLTVTAKRTMAGGDGLANVGYIDASNADGGTNLDLGLVSIKGDVGQIDAGDDDTSTAAIKGLSVQSMGQLGTSTQGAGASLESHLFGPLGFLKVTGNVKEAFINAVGSGPAGFVGAKIGAVTIGGSVIGGAANNSGSIESRGPIGAVKIGGNIEGGGGGNSGRIQAPELTSLTLGGSLLGGAGSSSGVISASTTGPVKIGGNVEGGSGPSSGSIFTQTLASLTLGGSLIGGSQSDSGEISSTTTMGPVKITGHIKGGSANATGAISGGGTLASLTLGGSLLGGSGTYSGAVSFDGAIGPVTIAGDIVGGGDINSGWVSAGGTLASLTLGGSLLGGANTDTGEIVSTGAMGAVKIGGNIEGKFNTSGRVHTDSTLASFTLGGSLLGGSSHSGEISSVGAMGAVKIGGNIEGGDISNAGQLSQTGYISAGRIASLFVGGSIISGTTSGGGQLGDSGAVRATDDIGAITIKGSLVGNAGRSVVITARGQATPGATADVAIKSLSVGGRVEFADILAGYGSAVALTGVNADAQIGAVTVGGDWIASNLMAGVQDDATADRDQSFGDGDDSTITGTGTAARFSKIASIVINGAVLGDSSGFTHTYGFGAQEIGSFKVNGNALTLKAGRSNDTFAGMGIPGSAVPVGPSLNNLGNEDGFAVHVFEV